MELSLLDRSFMSWFLFLLWMFRGYVGFVLPHLLTCSAVMFVGIIASVGDYEIYRRHEQGYSTCSFSVLDITMRIRFERTERVEKVSWHRPDLGGVACE